MINEAINAVAQITDVTIEQLLSKSRVQHICEARHITAYVLRTLLGYSTNAVGKMLNRTHASVIRSSRMCQDWLDDERLNPRGAHIIKQLIEELKKGADIPFTNRNKND